jgi:hypothetical protein
VRRKDKVRRVIVLRLRQRDSEKIERRRMGSSGTCSLWSGFLGSGGQQLRASVAAAKQRTSPSLSFVTVEAKAKTRREDRTARHIRIRKKVSLSLHFFM